MDQTAFLELEIGLHRWFPGSYSAELRRTLPGPDGAVEVRIVHGIDFDLENLRVLRTKPAEYGRLLSKSLFADPVMRETLIAATSQTLQLRLRLFVGPNVPELHALLWETLADPRSDDGAPLVTSQRVLFSRYLSSTGYLSDQQVRLRAQSDLTALVAVADPTGTADYTPDGQPTKPIDVSGEVSRAKTYLGDMPTAALASKGSATLANIVAHLQEGADILYLVCHGLQHNGQPLLWLEAEDGSIAVTSGDDLVAAIRDLREAPRLVVLASCRSAGSGTDGGDFERAIGPRLAGAGIAAVVAMQGDIDQETVKGFVPAFFNELQIDGQIDRAMAVARGAVRDQPDSWMPILFMRPQSGLLWYTPGFSVSSNFNLWPALEESIDAGKCTPLLGPGMYESYLGSPREIARAWAEEFGFPLAPDDRDDLPQVAQYLAVEQKAEFPPSAFRRYVRDALLKRYEVELPEEIRGDPDAPIHDVIAAIGAKRRDNPADPHRVLAELGLPVYITTSPGNLLFEALKAAGRDPKTEISRWNEDSLDAPSIFRSDPTYEPSPERPLVYHVYGHFDYPGSLVLTEDDYFDYLIGLTKNQDLIPTPVITRLTKSSLLFLGFQMDNWIFRVLFRTIMSQEGGTARRRFAHVAVQLDPAGGRNISQSGARRYLEKYFRGADVDVYWGRVEDFAADLQRKIKGNGR